MLAALREHPEWRNAIRREILTEELLELPARFAAAELRREEDSRRIWETIERLTEAQSRTEAALRTMGIELNRNSGDLLEIRVERKLDRYLGELLAISEPIENRFRSAAAHLAEEMGALTASERREISTADVLVGGIDSRGKDPRARFWRYPKGSTHGMSKGRTAGPNCCSGRSGPRLRPTPAGSKAFSSPPVQAFAVVVGRTISDQARRGVEQRGVVFAEADGGYDWERNHRPSGIRGPSGKAVQRPPYAAPSGRFRIQGSGADPEPASLLGLMEVLRDWRDRAKPDAGWPSASAGWSGRRPPSPNPGPPRGFHCERDLSLETVRLGCLGVLLRNDASKRAVNSIYKENFHEKNSAPCVGESPHCDRTRP
ncbi:hypothetical protein MAMC_01852 [Methylacidimicrobium cyclopophantes]|uniref:Uncharacterized protein n=2 Tax=Methylacidimicrobium cyclopophantes TaxID=1041766 RepID=A0A5E6MIR2_9BACT|nr:hypothetical protein MAMC_01852 [Methylacidimicrobium cyclopophantes]